MVDDAGQLMQLISLGRLVAVVPQSVRTRLHSGLICRSVSDAPTATLVLGWPQNGTSPEVASFVQAATLGRRCNRPVSDPCCNHPDRVM